MTEPAKVFQARRS